MNKTLKRILGLSAVLCLIISALAACEKTENESDSSSETESGTEAELVDFDYSFSDLSGYITLPSSAYQSNTVTLGTEYIITDKSVEDEITDILFSNKTKTDGDTQVKDQPIKLGDSAFIYYTGYLNGEKFEGGSNESDAKPTELSIGSGKFIPGFEEGLIGVIPSDTSKAAPFDLNVTFPKEYGNEELAGKAVVFKVWVEYVVQYTIPELTDDFVKNTLKFDGTVDEYKADIKLSMQEEMDAEAKDAALIAVLNKLIEASTISNYPQESVDYWYAAYIDQFEYYMQYYTMYGMTFKSFDDFVIQYLGLKEGEDWKAVTTGYAKEMVENMLVYYQIAKQENIAVSDAEFDAEVKELVKQYSSSSKTYTEDEIIEQLGESAIKQTVLFEKIDDFLMKNCTIEYKDE